MSVPTSLNGILPLLAESNHRQPCQTKGRRPRHLMHLRMRHRSRSASLLMTHHQRHPHRFRHVSVKWSLSRITAETNSTTLLLSEDATVPQSSVSLQPATSQPSASLKQKTRPPQVGSSGLLMHRAKKSMRKFGANDLCKISAWITQRLAKKFASKIAPSPSEQPTPAS